jgi:hypothetical protein
MIGKRWGVVALHGALWVWGCGGKAVTSAQPSAQEPDAATDAASEADRHASDAADDRSVHDASADSGLDASKDVSRDAPQDVAEEPDAVPEAGTDGGEEADAEWDHTCWCKNWDDQRYPWDLFGQFSCVNSTYDGYTHCLPGFVCCAITCVSPKFCVNSEYGWSFPPPPAQVPPNDCSNYYGDFPRCMPADLCAPDGILTPREYDPAIDHFPMCKHPGYTPPP